MKSRDLAELGNFVWVHHFNAQSKIVIADLYLRLHSLITSTQYGIMNITTLVRKEKKNLYTKL